MVLSNMAYPNCGGLALLTYKGGKSENSDLVLRSKSRGFKIFWDFAAWIFRFKKRKFPVFGMLELVCPKTAIPKPPLFKVRMDLKSNLEDVCGSDFIGGPLGSFPGLCVGGGEDELGL